MSISITMSERLIDWANTFSSFSQGIHCPAPTFAYSKPNELTFPSWCNPKTSPIPIGEGGLSVRWVNTAVWLLSFRCRWLHRLLSTFSQFRSSVFGQALHECEHATKRESNATHIETLRMYCATFGEDCIVWYRTHLLKIETESLQERVFLMWFERFYFDLSIWMKGMGSIQLEAEFDNHTGALHMRAFVSYLFDSASISGWKMRRMPKTYWLCSRIGLECNRWHFQSCELETTRCETTLELEAPFLFFLNLVLFESRLFYFFDSSFL